MRASTYASTDADERANDKRTTNPRAHNAIVCAPELAAGVGECRTVTALFQARPAELMRPNKTRNPLTLFRPYAAAHTPFPESNLNSGDVDVVGVNESLKTSSQHPKCYAKVCLCERARKVPLNRQRRPHSDRQLPTACVQCHFLYAKRARHIIVCTFVHSAHADTQ